MKIISLNIEINKHYSRIFSFFFNESADIILIQDILEADLEFFKDKLQMEFVFIPFAKLKLSEGIKTVGIATFSKLKIIKTESNYYRGTKDLIQIIESDEPHKMTSAILTTFIENETKQLVFINTFFNWADGGVPTQAQLIDLGKLLKLIARYRDFVLCGDFNAPRGKEVFDKLASTYKDNIPKDVTSTIDKNLHHAGDLNIVVDGLFSTRYLVENVHVVDGVSDHKAIVADTTYN